MRNVLLLLASLFFYGAGEGAYIALLVASIVLNYLLGLLIDAHRLRVSARWALSLGVTTNLLLGGFKYLGFAVTNLNAGLIAIGVLHAPGLADPDIHLPIGISFFTFQALSYLVDIYRGHVAAQRRLIDFGLYLSLFPQLIVMIVVIIGWVFFRADNLSHALDYLRAMAGLNADPVLSLGTFTSPAVTLTLLIGAIGSTPIVPALRDWTTTMLGHRESGAHSLDLVLRLGRTMAVAILMAACVAFSAAATYNPFIYFRF